MLSLLVWLVGYKMKIVIEGNPKPKIRMTGKSKWSPRARECLAEQDRIAWIIKALKLKPILCDIELDVKFYREGKRRADLSNLIKLLEDGIQYSGLIKNDSQIIKIIAEVHYESKSPRTEFRINTRL